MKGRKDGKLESFYLAKKFIVILKGRVVAIIVFTSPRVLSNHVKTVQAVGDFETPEHAALGC
jgi:hypothetical protein